MRRASAFHHEAVFYADDAEYVQALMPPILETLAADGAVLVAAPATKGRLLAGALGEDSDRVRFVDMEALGRNPACIMPVWREFVREGDGPLLGIGEPAWPGRSDAEMAECRRHECLLNLAFDGWSDWRLLCPYDAGALPSAVLEDARHNHPHLSEHGHNRRSESYVEPCSLLAWDTTLPPPAREPAELPFTRDDLALVRDFITARARSAGFGGARLSDIVLAVNELATNSMRHGGGGGALRTWEEHGTFLCEVRDGGRIADPLAGRERPSDLRDGGRGLWIVNHLCDLVQMRSSHAGSVVRVHISV